MKKNLVLLDAHAVLHRAFHALPKFTSPKGEPTGALYGFVSFLLKIIREINPEYIAACYDLPKPTFRHETYAGYKAKRPKVDDALVPQFNRSRDILFSFGIPSYSTEGFEADDLLGSIVEKTRAAGELQKENFQIIIASGDMDTLQLVEGEKVLVYTLRKGINDTVFYNEAAVKERFGFAPALLADFKGLRGDPSDNIIGVPGIGEKTAIGLIKNFGEIEKIYKALESDSSKLEGAGVKQRIIKLLKENEEAAMFSKTLAEIRKDAPTDFELEKCAWKRSFSADKPLALFGELGFRTLSARLLAVGGDIIGGK